MRLESKTLRWRVTESLLRWRVTGESLPAELARLPHQRNYHVQSIKYTHSNLLDLNPQG